MIHLFISTTTAAYCSVNYSGPRLNGGWNGIENGASCSILMPGQLNVVYRIRLVPILIGVLPNTNKMVVQDGFAWTQNIPICSGSTCTDSILWDFKDKTWIPSPEPQNSFCSSGVISPGSGKLITVGGTLKSVSSVMSYSLQANSWNVNGNLYFPRYYTSTLTLPDGRIMVAGGRSGFDAVPRDWNSPSIEFIPLQKTYPVTVPALARFENSYYVPMYVLPSGRVFMLTKNEALTFDVNVVTKLGSMENGFGRAVLEETKANQVVLMKGVGYDVTSNSIAANIMLPLGPFDFTTAIILVCGGTNPTSNFLDDANVLAKRQCYRMNTTDPNPIWVADDLMPVARNAGEFIWLPDGTAFLTNGGKKGIYTWNTLSEPVYEKYIYDPKRAPGTRFRLVANSTIGRYYHSTAILLPNGTVFISGSTPCDANVAVCKSDTGAKYETRVEIFTPPYLLTGLKRPTIASVSSSSLRYMSTITLQVSNVDPNIRIGHQVSIIPATVVTHGNHPNQRLVFLTVLTKTYANNVLTIQLKTPNNANIAPPGWYMLTFVDGRTLVPSESKWVQIGGDPSNLG